MKKPRLDQLLAGYADGDAISHMANCLRRVFRSWGYTADIFADLNCVSPALRSDCRPLADYHPEATDICLHHYGIASPAAEYFVKTPARKIMIYHNITPAEFFKGYDDQVAQQLDHARRRLPEIARCAHAVWTVSNFNAVELAALGIANVHVFPLIFDATPFTTPPQPLIIEKFRGNLKNILFVGRIAPNKRVEDLIAAFAWYHKTLNPYSRLLIVGSNRSAPRYYTMLRMLAGDYDLPNVCFEGFANTARLAAYYRVADLYVCPSAHEGYCLPLLEAMHHDVPVLARISGGMPEAMDGAGVLYDDLDAPQLAALMQRLLDDEALRQNVITAQKRRMQKTYGRDIGAELETLLSGYLEKTA